MPIINQNTLRPQVSTVFTSEITEWDDNKGFGYLLHQKRKLFLHYKDFSARHKRPAIGDQVQYKLGYDTKGRKCAVEAAHVGVEAKQVHDRGRLTLFNWVTLVLLLLIPLASLNKAIVLNEASPLYVTGAGLALIFFNVVTYGAYAGDKHQARAKEWRTPERSLHILEAVGGWPAAFIAQRKLRHKISKAEFQLVYWFIVISHILIALDYMRDWRLITAIFTQSA